MIVEFLDTFEISFKDIIVDVRREWVSTSILSDVIKDSRSITMYTTRMLQKLTSILNSLKNEIQNLG